MFKKLLFLLCFVYGVNAQDSLRYSIDLNRLENDRLRVEVKLPQGVKEFCFPKMVPGTYAIYNFGRYVSNLQAFDASGKVISVFALIMAFSTTLGCAKATVVVKSASNVNDCFILRF